MLQAFRIPRLILPSNCHANTPCRACALRGSRLVLPASLDINLCILSCLTTLPSSSFSSLSAAGGAEWGSFASASTGSAASSNSSSAAGGGDSWVAF